MISLKGAVPKCTFLYSLIKLILVLYDLKAGTFKALPPKFAVFEFLKLFLIAFKITKLEIISKKLHYRLSLLSFLIEGLLFIYEKNHISDVRFILEIVFGALGCIFLVYFHPLYSSEQKLNKKD